LRGVDLEVARGEIVLITGANGAGKTTLLRVLAGLLPLAAGTASVLGWSLSRQRSQVRRRVALVADTTSFYDDLSVRANLVFHAKIAGRTSTDVDELLDRFGLAGLAERPHGRLSAGQRRRCALAGAVARRRELLLLDEPHGNLDADGRGTVDDLIARHASEGGTVLLVSHDVERARGLADREVVLADGTLHAPAGAPVPQ
jgi:heme ABC exporter ATP-binding subunit CcmA